MTIFFIKGEMLLRRKSKAEMVFKDSVTVHSITVCKNVTFTLM